MTTTAHRTLDDQQLRQYLSRLGFDAPPAPDARGLRALHRAHLQSVPFENLDIHLGRQIRLDVESVMAKLLDQNRGGYCYELNGAFASLLSSLGFDVDLLEARVFSGDELGIHFDHACLRINLDEPWLADVGFGACFEYPLRLQNGTDQQDPAGTYRIVQRAKTSLDLDENSTPKYRFSLTLRALEEFADASHFQQTSPASHFTHNTVCSLATERGRVTVKGLKMIETIDGDRNETAVPPDRLGSVLTDRFGIELAKPDLDLLLRKT